MLFVLSPKSFVTNTFINQHENGRRGQCCCFPPLVMSSGPRFAHSPLSRRTILYLLPFSLSMFCESSATSSETTGLSVSESKPNNSGVEVKENTSLNEKPISDIDPATDEPQITDHVFVDLSISGKPSHRLVIALYGNLMPRVVTNFKKLAANGYTDTPVYRIVPGLTIQLGDVLRNGGKIGQAAIDDGQSFIPDNFRVKHTKPGIVSMVRRPDGTVDSRFFIATRIGDSMYLDGRYAAFGRVVEGMEFLREVEKAGGEGFIRRPVRVVSSGVLE